MNRECVDCPYMQEKDGEFINCRECMREEEEDEKEERDFDFEAQRTDAAERENHRREVEGEIE